ncbi:hypothetical protein HYY72_03225 [Candidatus Woesearchaeota archaeon]|nr:hypothetical protein [Candidatus Woesearchaeota archaeon]
MAKTEAADFSLKHTLECGQIFRYELVNGHYYLVAGDVVLKLAQDGSSLYYESSRRVSEEFVRRLFRLDEDYESIIASISRDALIRKAIASSYGLRIIRQEPWECMISYICSSNSSVARVKGCTNSLSERFGRKIRLDRMEFFSFPRKIGGLDAIRECGLGYRSQHLFETLGMIDRKGLERLRYLKYADAKTELVRLRGIGEKVADCILLYSLGFTQAFPVDRWIKRVMQENYFGNNAASNSKISEYAIKYFGKNAGYAQQFLYHYTRSTPKQKPPVSLKTSCHYNIQSQIRLCKKKVLFFSPSVSVGERKEVRISEPNLAQCMSTLLRFSITPSHRKLFKRLP